MVTRNRVVDSLAGTPCPLCRDKHTAIAFRDPNDHSDHFPTIEELKTSYMNYAGFELLPVSCPRCCKGDDENA